MGGGWPTGMERKGNQVKEMGRVTTYKTTLQHNSNDTQHFSIILISMSRSLKMSLSSHEVFQAKLYMHFLCPPKLSCPIYLILLNVITVTIIDE
jgi:hypothetical protein